MAASFDGDNLIMTLDTTTKQDVRENWFEDWKDWHRAHPDNRKYPPLFFSEGGGPVDATQSQGGYIRTNNAAGWRIKPPEQDIEIQYTGSLLKNDQSLPIFNGVDGNFSAFVYNVQPITTVVTIGSGVTAQDKIDIIDELMTRIIENGETFAEAFRLIRAEAAGTITRTGTSHKIKSADGLTDRIEATADENGRTVTAVDGT